MFPYCLKYKKITENINPIVVKTKNGRIMLSSNYAICGSKKSQFIKEEEAKELLIMIGKIPLLGPLLI